MNNQGLMSSQAQSAWRVFCKREELSLEQAKQFEQYLGLLLEWNKKFNLTAITDPQDVIAHHFSDSVRLDRYVDMSSIQTVCDIGSGGGFPGIPLKIKHPHLRVVLLEVNQKKISFLEYVIAQLGLPDVEVCSMDWRTFLRNSSYSIDLFCARASLHTDELLRLFKLGCRYHNARLVYFASKHWEPQDFEKPYIEKIETYNIENRPRVYAFFRAPTTVL